MIKKILFLSLIIMLMIGAVSAERTDEHGYKGETNAESLLLLYEDGVISYAEYQKLTENLNKNLAEDGLNVSNEIDIPEGLETVIEEKQAETVTKEKQKGLIKLPDKKPETDNSEQIITELQNLETSENNQVITEKSFIDRIMTFLNSLIGG